MKRRFLAIFCALLLTTSLIACRNEEQESGSEDTTDKIIQIDPEKTTEKQETPTEADTTGESEKETDPVADVTFVEKKDTVYVIANNGAVNLRTATVITNETIRCSVPNGTELKRIAVSADGVWSKVVYEDEELYIKSLYVTGFADLDAGFEEMGVAAVLTLKASLNVRITPSMDNEILHVLEPGDKVLILAENEEIGWIKIMLQDGSGLIGYAAADDKYYEEDVEILDVEATLPEGFGMTLPDGYLSLTMEGTAGCYTDGQSIIILNKEKRADFEGTDYEGLNGKEYAELLMALSELPGDVKTEGTAYTFEYDGDIGEGVIYHYLAYVFESEDAFWTLQFSTAKADFEANRATYKAIAATVEIK